MRPRELPPLPQVSHKTIIIIDLISLQLLAHCPMSELLLKTTHYSHLTLLY